MNPRPEIRLGDAERETAVSALGEHYAAGRLTKEEYDERADRAWSARYGSDLTPLFLDLPALNTPGSRATVDARPSGGTAARRPHGRVPLLPVFLLVLGIVMLTHFPWPFVLLFGWLLWRGVLWRWVGAGRWGQGWPQRQAHRHW